MCLALFCILFDSHYSIAFEKEFAMADLSGFRVAVLATDGFEESELTDPVKALKSAGAEVTIVSLKSGKIQGYKHSAKGSKVNVDQTIQDVNPSDFDGVQLPGGTLNADT